MDRFKNQRGLTLVEILLVVMIIGIIAAMVVPNIAGRGEEARFLIARTDIEANLASALDMYELDNGRLPTTEQGLNALIVEPVTSPVPNHWKGPYLKKKRIPQDPWGRPYVYRFPGEQNPAGYDLMSYGSDGIESEDDITNWAVAGSEVE
ncbi:MAG TPA: type II secretion system major pseudopilin GspG [Candidatus Omnitrophota bacterium]|nr:type II secretion system major pseudopilin GspG [Candidatus Omnitrophota bacterium]